MVPRGPQFGGGRGHCVGVIPTVEAAFLPSVATVLEDVDQGSGAHTDLLKLENRCGPGLASTSLQCSVASSVFSLLFLKDFIYLFLERREGREKEKERNIDV